MNSSLFVGSGGGGMLDIHLVFVVRQSGSTQGALPPPCVDDAIRFKAKMRWKEENSKKNSLSWYNSLCAPKTTYNYENAKANRTRVGQPSGACCNALPAYMTERSDL